MSYIRKLIIKNNIKPYACSNEKCGLADWHGSPIGLQLDHINGNRKDNRLENLRWLCPNCHSQTPTFRGRGVKRNKEEYICIDCDNKILKNSTRCRDCNNKFRFGNTKKEKKITNPNWRFELKVDKRKVVRPTLEVLKQEVKELGYSSVGRKYGVSDNAIRKWIKIYEKNTVL